jgi:hypothetical protein
MFLRRACSHVHTYEWLQTKKEPVTEEYGVDERINNLSSKYACTYAQISLSKDQWFLKMGLISHQFSKLMTP